MKSRKQPVFCKEMSVTQNKINWVTLSTAIVLAAGIRIALYQKFDVINTDGVFYCWNARGIFQGGLVRETFFGLYPVMIGILNFVIADLQVSASFISIASSVMLVPIVYLLAIKLYDFRVAGCAAMITAVLSPVIWRSFQAYTEPLYSLLFTLAVYLFIIFWEKPTWKRSIIFGIGAAMTYMTRAEGISVIFFGAFFLLILKSVSEDILIKNRYAQIIVFSLVFIIFCAPQWIYLYHLTGKWGITAKDLPVDQWTPDLRLSNDFEKGKTLYGELAKKRGEESYGEEAFRKIKGYIQNIRAVFTDQLADLWILLIWSPLGMVFFGHHSKKQLFRIITVGMILPPFIVIPYKHFLGRYFESYLPIIGIFSAAGVIIFAEYLVRSTDFIRFEFLKRHLKTNFGKAVIFTLVSGTIFLPFLYQDYKLYSRDPINWYRAECKAAGEWIASNISGKQFIASRYPQTAFYADADFIPLPWGEIDEIIVQAREKGATLFVLERTATRRKRPRLTPLLTGDAPAPDSLRLIQREPAYSIFEILPES